MPINIPANEIGLALVSAMIGIVATLVVQRLLNKRGLLTYTVRHNRVAASAEDAVWGTVRVLWNDNPVRVLYASTVELTNDSLTDFEGINVRVFSTTTMLLTERTEYSNSIDFPRWTGEFAQLLSVPAGDLATPDQLDIYTRRREYLLSTLNRGQTVRFAYLNTPRGDEEPSIWLDVMHKGAKLEFRAPRIEFMGVPQPVAAGVGLMLGIVVILTIVRFVEAVWLAAVLAFAFGAVAQVPGAAAVRVWRSLRRRLSD